MSFSELCMRCPHTRDQHTLDHNRCAVCEEERDGLPYEPGEEFCEYFQKSQMCGLCGGRMSWHDGLRGYFHANDEDDLDHEAEPRTRRARRKV